MKNKWITIILGAGLSFSLCAADQQLLDSPIRTLLFSDLEGFKDRSSTSHEIYWENDSLYIPGGSDRWYTNGIRYKYTLHDPVTYLETTYGDAVLETDNGKLVVRYPDDIVYPVLYNEKDGKVSIRKHKSDFQDPGDLINLSNPTDDRIDDIKRVRQNYGYVIGQNIYTPVDIELEPDQIDLNDRPYAGWLYVGVFDEKFYSDSRYVKVEWNIGCTGPCSQAEDTQKWFHEDVTDSTEPLGWDQQIGDELGLQFAYTEIPAVWLLSDTDAAYTSQELNLDFAPFYEFNIGNIFSNASVGGTLRFGKLNSYFAGNGIPFSFEKNGQIQKRLYSSPHIKATTSNNLFNTVEWFLFIRGELRAVAHNALLEGTTTSDPHRVDTSPGVADLEVGFALHWESFSLIVTQAARTSEIKNEHEGFKHKYGSFRLIWRSLF